MAQCKKPWIAEEHQLPAAGKMVSVWIDEVSATTIPQSNDTVLGCKADVSRDVEEQLTASPRFMTAPWQALWNGRTQGTEHGREPEGPAGSENKKKGGSIQMHNSMHKEGIQVF